MTETTLELTRVNPDLNIFSIKCGTNIYFVKSMRFGPSSSHNFKEILKKLSLFLYFYSLDGTSQSLMRAKFYKVKF